MDLISSRIFYFLLFITKLIVTSPIKRRALEMENNESDMKMLQINNSHSFFFSSFYYKVNCNIIHQSVKKKSTNEEQRKGYEDALDK
jgi:hypothetical protein